ncbi:HEPN family nuclease, partial [Escherichia coli]|uniref:HEPN family nuclease n=1 Tax=Escherichia coli TaxID=562 RepID=UPI002341E6FD
MGNYSDFETDFVQRTLALIDQYNEMIEVLGKPFREQYNCKRLVRTVLIFTESSDQLSRATDRVP